MDQKGEVVDLPEQDHPAVVGSVVLVDFLKSVVSLLMDGHGHVLLEVIFVRKAVRVVSIRVSIGVSG